MVNIEVSPGHVLLARARRPCTVSAAGAALATDPLAGGEGAGEPGPVRRKARGADTIFPKSISYVRNIHSSKILIENSHNFRTVKKNSVSLSSKNESIKQTSLELKHSSKV